MSDVFKELPVRIIGFSFGIAQAARYRFSAKTVDLFDATGSFFVVAHLVFNIVTEKSVPGLIKTFCFEAICTCIIPPVVNYYFCGFVADVLRSVSQIPNIIKRWGPFVAGLMTIPVLLLYVDPPIDEFINSLF